MALPTRVNRSIQYDPLESAQHDFDALMGRLLGQREADGGGYLAPYGVDVREDQDHIYVEAELPGFKKDDVNITLENQTLSICAERKAEKKEGGDQSQHLLRERRYTRFERSFTLPPTVNEQSVDAKLNEGILTITLNKKEESKPRKINVG